MKKLLISVNGKRYEVDVEVLEDDDASYMPQPPMFRPPQSRAADLPQPSAPATGAPAPRPASHRPMSANSKNLTSPINGTVLDVKVVAGDSVNENQVLFVVEAMKMKTNVSSPISGVVASVEIKVRDVIEQGQLLLTYE